MGTRKSAPGGGSFHAVRTKHLRMFDPSANRHDRGWPHDPPPAEKGPRQNDCPPKRSWKTAGIFHFPDDEGDEAGEQRNAPPR